MVAEAVVAVLRSTQTHDQPALSEGVDCPDQSETGPFCYDVADGSFDLPFSNSRVSLSLQVCLSVFLSELFAQ